jgi:hypothetical protein
MIGHGDDAALVGRAWHARVLMNERLAAYSAACNLVLWSVPLYLLYLLYSLSTHPVPCNQLQLQELSGAREVVEG